jgi:hypothetical protein
MGILEYSGMVTGYVIVKVETGSSEEGILVWIETLLLYQTKIIQSVVFTVVCLRAPAHRFPPWSPHIAGYVLGQ